MDGRKGKGFASLLDENVECNLKSHGQVGALSRIM